MKTVVYLNTGANSALLIDLTENKLSQYQGRVIGGRTPPPLENSGDIPPSGKMRARPHPLGKF